MKWWKGVLGFLVLWLFFLVLISVSTVLFVGVLMGVLGYQLGFISGMLGATLRNLETKIERRG